MSKRELKAILKFIVLCINDAHFQIANCDMIEYEKPENK